MLFRYINKKMLVLIFCIPLFCQSNQGNEPMLEMTNILKTINPNFSERKLNQLIAFDKQLSFIDAFRRDYLSNNFLPNTINLQGVLQEILKKEDPELMLISQSVNTQLLANNIKLDSFSFHISTPKESVNNEKLSEQLNLSVFIFTDNEDLKNSYLLAEKEFLYSFFFTNYSDPEVENIENLGTAASKIFPLYSGDFVWVYKNVFFSVKQNSSFELSIKLARAFQQELEKHVIDFNQRIRN